MATDMIILKIKDRRYGMRKMPPMKGASFGLKVANTMAKLAKAKEASDVLTSLRKDFFDESGDAKQNIDEKTSLTTGASLLSLVSYLDPTDLENIFKEAFSYEVYYEEISLTDQYNFESHFQKHPGDLYVVAIWATYHHVCDFFTGLGDGIKALIPSSKTAATVQ